MAAVAATPPGGMPPPGPRPRASLRPGGRPRSASAPRARTSLAGRSGDPPGRTALGSPRGPRGGVPLVAHRSRLNPDLLVEVSTERGRVTELPELGRGAAEEEAHGPVGDEAQPARHARHHQ